VLAKVSNGEVPNGGIDEILKYYGPVYMGRQMESGIDACCTFNHLGDFVT
jgi:hypothetical protein